MERYVILLTVFGYFYFNISREKFVPMPEFEPRSPALRAGALHLSYPGHNPARRKFLSLSLSLSLSLCLSISYGGTPQVVVLLRKYLYKILT